MCYEGNCAPDLSEVAERVDLSEEEVIKRHLAKTLTVSVMGFCRAMDIWQVWMKGLRYRAETTLEWQCQRVLLA